MITFFISLLMISISSYSIVSSFYIRKYYLSLMAIFIFIFALNIIQFEVLSLFNLISTKGIFASNIIIFIFSILIWHLKGNMLYIPDIKMFIKRLKASIHRDKVLGVLFLGFIYVLFSSFVLSFLLPVTTFDAQLYNVPRVFFWIDQFNLAHVDSSNIRINIMPFNSELLYLWIILFSKTDRFLGLFSFVSYIVSLIALLSIFEQLKISFRRQIWTIFVLSATAGIICNLSSVNSIILVGGLFLSALAFYIYYKKNNDIFSFFLASCNIAISLGVKTSAFFMIVPFVIVCIFINLSYSKQIQIKNILILILFIVINFIIFSSYNYIINLIDYKCIFGTLSSIEFHRAFFDFKLYVLSFIRTIISMVDFSGCFDSFSVFIIENLRRIMSKFIIFYNAANDYNPLSDYDFCYINNSINENYVGYGLVGSFVIVPSIILSIKSFMQNKNKKIRTWLFFLLTISFFICIVMMCLIITFFSPNIRHLTSFLIFLSPVLALTYIKGYKNVYKYIMAGTILYSMIMISSFISQRSFFYLAKYLLKGFSLKQEQYYYMCESSPDSKKDCNNIQEIKKIIKNAKCAIFTSEYDNLIQYFLLKKENTNIDILFFGDLSSDNIKNYEYVIFTRKEMIASYLPEKKFDSSIFVCEYLNKFYKPATDDDIVIISQCNVPQKFLLENNFRKIPLNNASIESTIFKNELFAK